ncbi:hypothetical protein E1B28_011485 [Marasmius oreades]|uniref:Uncharacterized protein n=1 Tax=Marasmius oreades TaxID=181124 RepID=A0A9P7US50_9AGAR|nr:uncharacterized protein E1B28_011485 [Marasmius oreades]KAG7089839.1 hypothetical protein E1B28_011485 [Marasmius oreades]
MSTATPQSLSPLMPQRRSKKVSRPSTAPTQEAAPLLPSSSASSSPNNATFLSPQGFRSHHLHMQTLAESDDSSDQSSSRPHSTPSTPNEPLPSSASPQDSSNPLPASAQPSYRYNHTPYSYDWATFISAYASGRWDPHRTPNPPLSSINPDYAGLGLRGVVPYLNAPLAESKPRQAQGIEENESFDPSDAHQQCLIDDLRTPTLASPSPSTLMDLHLQTSTSKRPPNDAPTLPDPYHPPIQHRSRNFSSSVSVVSPSKKSKHVSLRPLPLGSSLSVGSSSVRNGSDIKAPKAKADLFLPLPHRLPILPFDTVSPGATSPSPYSAAIQSNALHPNSSHPDAESDASFGKKVPPIHSTSAPLPPHATMPPTLPSTICSTVTNAPHFTDSPQPQHYQPSRPSRLSNSTPSQPLMQSQQLPSFSSSSPSSQNLLHVSSHLSSYIAPPKFPQIINAATMRLAGSNVNISPLALPSPEHELMDPMRDFCVTVPGTLPEYAGLVEKPVDVDGSISEGENSSHINGLISPSSSSSSLASTHHKRNGSSGISTISQESAGGEFRGFSGESCESPGSATGTITTPGGTTRRVRLSMEWKKFWEGMKDVDSPVAEVGIIPPSDSDSSSSPVSVFPGLRRSKTKGKSPTPLPEHAIPSPSNSNSSSSLTQVEDNRLKTGGMDGDYFSRGAEFSASTFRRVRESCESSSPNSRVSDFSDGPGMPHLAFADETRGRGNQDTASQPTSHSHSDAPFTTTAPDLITTSDDNISLTTRPAVTPSRESNPRFRPPGPISLSTSNPSTSSASAHPEARQRTIPISAPMLPSYSFPYPYTHSQVIMHPTGAMTVPVPMYSTSSSTAGPLNGAGNRNRYEGQPGKASPSSSKVDSTFQDVAEQPVASSLPLPRRVNLMRQTSAPLPVLGPSSLDIGGITGAMYKFGSHGGSGGVLPVLPALEDATGSIPPSIEIETSTIIGDEGGADATRPTSGLEGLPMLNSQQRQGLGGIPSSASVGPGVGVGVQGVGMRAAKEEQMFHEIGYLAPPNPPDELERRRALYKFNIWNTGSDLNFDRIAHLAKLVFNTKGVFISLLDGNEQWFKSEWGMKIKHTTRVHSVCAHTILQRDDEPMVVLDTWADWRFAKNPNVIGVPHLRFYAGAPLRTQDGYNVGSLAVIDDAPREEFTPRHRHTLKEFAAIAMREMELWRDKIQLRIRDRIQSSMEQFSRECLEIDMEQQSQAERSPGRSQSSQVASPEPGAQNITGEATNLRLPSSMDRVYDRAAKLVQRTLDVEGVIVMDVSHCEVLESMSGEGSVSVVLHHGDPDVQQTTTKHLTADEYAKLNAFFAKYPDGYISDEGFVPQIFRQFLPNRVQYALTVPIFNIDKRPFALLCAYNASEHTKRFLEGHELSYLRAIGVIILSAVLKRRMILADKAKSLFISNISHELRTPLHGILAAAELLSDSDLNHSQVSFLQTVQACGTSLVETVNHVLDFTKLSGNSKAGGVENVILPTKVDLLQLVEEAVDGCWIGHRARTAIMEDTGIGSVYSPPKEDNSVSTARRKHVETVIDVSGREGWLLKCEKGGIRRVLMNVFGNSLKFTSDGFVHVMLRHLPPTDSDYPGKVKVELSVLDSGKGISQNFLKNQLFHPFSQENPLQTGTGLGLAIVNSIVTSESVGGKVDVWSEEGVGTEIKVTFHAEVPEDSEESTTSSESGRLKFDDPHHPHTVSLVGFDSEHRGVQLLRSTLENFLVSWWGFELRAPEAGYGEIIILNEEVGPVIAATESRDTSRPFVVLSASRGSPAIMSAVSEYESIGGFCRVVYKPGGPSRIRSVLKLCLHALKISSGQPSRGNTPGMTGSLLDEKDQVSHKSFAAGGPLSSSFFIPPRRNSEQTTKSFSRRPTMSPRSLTIHPNSSPSWSKPSATVVATKEEKPDPDTVEPTISVGSGGTLLKSSVGTIHAKEQKVKILVVEDNSILRNLLVKWLKSKGYDFRDAVDGRDGVNVYSKEGPFDVVLLDLSMPVLDGIGATAEIRQFEMLASNARHSRIVALTGMSSLEDKRRAFEAGVDGYLVKPVAFKTLDEMLHKLGIA